MALSNFRVEQGIEILSSNSDDGVWLLQGAGAPLGNTGPTDNAPIGSVWYRTDSSGEMYRKATSTSQASDWVRFADESIYDLIGVAFGATDLGTFTGATIPDNQDVKEALQALETALESVSGAAVAEDINVTTAVVLDSCLVDNCFMAEWEVVMIENGAPGNRRAVKITAIHDGGLDGVADATDVDYSKHTKLKLGSNNGFTYDVAISGTGAAQVMELTVSATNASTFKSRRTDIL